jgi:amidase
MTTSHSDAAPAARSTAAGIARLVRSGELTPADSVAASLGRITAHDDRIGAFQVVRAERALAEATALAADPRLPDLPLAGVPIAIKDNVAVRGEPMRVGSAATSDRPSPADHPVVGRLRAAGAVVVGITRVPELCIFGTTDSVYGVTRNPWSLDRTAGGSSGGAAAAVAAGMVPVAHAADGAGSIRIPSACCGVFGIKPGRGVVPAQLGPTDWYGMTENGPITTTVEDAALLLSVMADRPGLAEVREPEGPLRIAVSIQAPLPGVTVDREHAKAVIRTAKILEAAGHQIEAAELAVPTSVVWHTLKRWYAGAHDDAELLPQADLERRTRVHAALGARVKRHDPPRPEEADAWRMAALQFFAPYDVLLAPVLANPPIAAARWGERGWVSNVVANLRYAPFGAAWNLAGWPAASVPAGVHPEAGTPLSVQLVAPEGAEALLLGLAAQLERLRPWRRTAPGY